jgi:hypothetical protein
MATYTFRTQRTIEVEADNETAANHEMQAELHDGEQVLSVERVDPDADAPATLIVVDYTGPGWHGIVERHRRTYPTRDRALTAFDDALDAYQRPELGRIARVRQGATIVEEIDQPPCDD